MFSNTSHTFCLALSLTAVTTLGMTSAAQAEVIIFDDADGGGWDTEWYTEEQGTDVHTGTTALQTTNGQLTFVHNGFVGSDHILEFYANTKDTTPATDLFILLTWTDADTTIHSAVAFDDRNVPAEYLIDGVPVDAGSSQNGIGLDTDTNTWQKIQLDLTQTAYTGFPFVEHTYDPGSATLTNITFRSDGGHSSNVVLDDVRLVPEPASLALFGLGAACLLARRRRTQPIG